MYCKYCGKEIDDKSQYCQYCGKELVDSKRVVIEFTKPNLDGATKAVSKAVGQIKNYNYSGLFSKQILSDSINAKLVSNLLEIIGVLFLIDILFLALAIFVSIASNQSDAITKLLVIDGILIAIGIAIFLQSYIYHIIKHIKSSHSK